MLVSILKIRLNFVWVIFGDLSIVNEVYTTCTKLYRIRYEGTLDETFQSNLGVGFGAYSIKTVAITCDNKILVGRAFNILNNVTISRYITLLNTNGSVDTAYRTNISSKFVSNISKVVETADAFVYTGALSSYSGGSYTGIAKI